MTDDEATHASLEVTHTQLLTLEITVNKLNISL